MNVHRKGNAVRRQFQDPKPCGQYGRIGCEWVDELIIVYNRNYIVWNTDLILQFVNSLSLKRYATLSTFLNDPVGWCYLGGC